MPAVRVSTPRAPDVTGVPRPATRCAVVALGLLVFLGATGSANALDPRRELGQYHHEKWTSEEGLPTNWVQALHQSRDGYLWIGTRGGYVRFDGSRIVRMSEPATPHRESAKFIHEDRDGNTWVSTSAGLYRHGASDVTRFAREDGFESESIGRIVEDHDGTLWVNTAAGLHRRVGDRFEPFSHVGLEGPVTLHAIRADDTLVLTAGNDLALFGDGELTLRTIEDPGRGIAHVSEDQAGHLIVGTWNGIVAVEADRATPFPIQTRSWSNVAPVFLRDHQGALWIGTDQGLYRFQDGSLTRFTMEDGLSDDCIVSLHEDSHGALWIGTWRAGLNRYLDGGFSSFDTADGLSDDYVSTIYENREGTLWVGTRSGGVTQLKDTHFTTFTRDHGLPSDMVFSIFEDRDGRTWFGTRKGLAHSELDDLQAFHIVEQIPEVPVTCITGDHAGRMWFGTQGLGVYRLEDGQYTAISTKQGLGSDHVRCLHVAGDDALWIGTFSGGLHRLVDDRIETWSKQDGLPSDAVTAILEDRSGVLWVGTPRGLARFGDGMGAPPTQHYDGGVLALVEGSSGEIWVGTEGYGLLRIQDLSMTAFAGDVLPDDVIYNVLEDGLGGLWLGSNRGVIKVSMAQLGQVAAGQRDTLDVQLFGRSNGIRSPECNGGRQPAALRNRRGELWFPTVGGAAMTDPAGPLYRLRAPPVYVESVLVDGAGLPQPLLTSGEYRFYPGAKRFEFRYTAPSYIFPERIRFKYMLEGFDSGWVDAGFQRVATYTNLPPGPHRFHVLASFGDGQWSEVGANFEFYLKPRFTQTVPFFGLCGAGCFLLGIGLVYLRLRRMRGRQRELEGLVDKRTGQLSQANDELLNANRELANANRQLEKLATMDGLTGIANRRRFNVVLAQEWLRLSRTEYPLSLVMLDIDSFKAYNDTYGHLQGDDCLRQVASLIDESARRPADLVARYGGEEFVILLPETDAEGGHQLAEVVRARVEGSGLEHRGSTVGAVVTVSAGVATVVPGPDASAEALIEAADDALYRSKKGGRNRVSGS